MGYQCQFHDGAGEATTLLTSLTTGNTAASCDQDMPIMLTGALAAYLEVDPGGLWTAIERFVKREAKKTPPQPAPETQDNSDSVSITCPFCQTEMVVLAPDADQAKQDHLAKCEAYAAAQKEGTE